MLVSNGSLPVARSTNSENQKSNTESIFGSYHCPAMSQPLHAQAIYKCVKFGNHADLILPIFDNSLNETPFFTRGYSFWMSGRHNELMYNQTWSRDNTDISLGRSNSVSLRTQLANSLTMFVSPIKVENSYLSLEECA